jgi:hypothetical protein
MNGTERERSVGRDASESTLGCRGSDDSLISSCGVQRGVRTRERPQILPEYDELDGVSTDTPTEE